MLITASGDGLTSSEEEGVDPELMAMLGTGLTGPRGWMIAFSERGAAHNRVLDPALALLCPVRALRIYVDHTRSFRSSEQLFVCHGGQQKGKAVSKQRLTHWIVDAIALAYQSQGKPYPLGVRALSTWSVASSYALVHGASLAKLRAGRHRTPSQDSTVSMLNQFFSMCWVTGNGWEVLAGVTLAAPFPLIQGCERLFPPTVQFPGWRTLVEFLQHPGSQTGWSILTPGPEKT